MRRTLSDALAALDEVVRGWAAARVQPGVRILVYPPEWEATMLVELRRFAQDSALQGRPVDVVDVGQAFVHDLDRDEEVVAAVAAAEEAGGSGMVLGDIGTVATRCLTSLLQRPLDGALCRLVLNTSSLATFVSYSAITSELEGRDVPPAVLAFPGEGDDSTLNILRLRGDTNYRTPRI